MKKFNNYFKLMSFAMLLIALQTSAQLSIVPSDCGLTYLYDNAGNRVARVRIVCSPLPPSGKTDETEESTWPLANTNDTTISKLELTVLYPNPTNGVVNVVFSESIVGARAVVSDNSGRIVHQATVSGQQVPIDLSSFTSGVYFVSIFADKRQFSRTVIKQ